MIQTPGETASTCSTEASIDLTFELLKDAILRRVWSPLSKNSISASSGRQKENPIKAWALHTPTPFFPHYALLDKPTVYVKARKYAYFYFLHLLSYNLLY